MCGDGDGHISAWEEWENEIKYRQYFTRFLSSLIPEYIVILHSVFYEMFPGMKIPLDTYPRKGV